MARCVSGIVHRWRYQTGCVDTFSAENCTIITCMSVRANEEQRRKRKCSWTDRQNSHAVGGRMARHLYHHRSATPSAGLRDSDEEFSAAAGVRSR